MKAVVAAFNQEKALVGAFSVIDYEPSDGTFWGTSSYCQDLQYVMRRAGHNPTDVEVQDLINKIDNG